MLTTNSRSGRSGAALTPKAGRPVHRSPTAKGGTFWVLVMLVTSLCLIGAVMVLSASSIMSLEQYHSPWYYFERQWMWLLIGSGGFALAMRVDHEHWRRWARPAMCGTVALLLAVLVAGNSVNGASRWIGPSSLQIQPSELAKLVLVLFSADVLDRRGDKGHWRYRATPVLAVLSLLVVLVMLQPDMGTTLVLVCIVGAVLFTAGLPAGGMFGLLGGVAAGGFLLAKAAPYRWQRLTSFLHPFKDPTNSGYQPVQGYLALSHGHVLGDGLGVSIASYGWLPNAQTDYIFAVIGEETGLVGGFFLSGLFLMLALVGIRIACRAPSRYAALVAAGITAWLVGQAVINIGAVVGILPVTGVPLPFVSFGGSSLVIAMFGVGMLANIARRS